MAVNGFGIAFLLALTMVIIFLKFVRVFTPTPTTILLKPPRSRWSTRRDQILQRSAMADANALGR